MKQRTANNITASIAGVLAFICFYMLIEEAGATSTKPHSQDQDQAQDQSQTADATSESVSASESASSASNEGNTLEGADVNVGGDSISNVYMSRAFAQDFPITHGCFQGLNAGGDNTTQTKSTGAFFGFTFLNNSCHMQALAAAEKDIDIVARLQCGDRKYRKAVAFDAPDGVSKREHCINIKKQSLMGAIELERKKLQEVARAAQEDRDRLNQRLIDERQACKDKTDETYQRCVDYYRK